MQKNAQKKPNVLIKNKTFIISASAKYKKIEQNKVIMDKKIKSYVCSTINYYNKNNIITSLHLSVNSNIQTYSRSTVVKVHIS